VRTRSGLLAACLFAAGCGGGGKEAPKPIQGPAKDVAAVIARLEKATATKDFSAICDELLSAATRKQAGGDQCASVLAERASDVRRPKIKVRAIEIQGERALARVRTTAVGQAATDDVIRLTRENGGYRISSLGR
jgi:hypothetical protein